MKELKTVLGKRVEVLLRDYGYEYRDGIVIQRGIRGHTSDRIWGRARNAIDAAEMLCPVIRDDEFFARLSAIMRPKA